MSWAHIKGDGILPDHLHDNITHLSSIIYCVSIHLGNYLDNKIQIALIIKKGLIKKTNKTHQSKDEAFTQGPSIAHNYTFLLWIFDKVDNSFNLILSLPALIFKILHCETLFFIDLSNWQYVGTHYD